MTRHLFDWLYAILERLLLLVDGHMPTQVRLKAVKPTHTLVQGAHVSGKRMRANVHRCGPPNGLPWSGGSWYCEKCRTWRIYQPLQLPRPEATAPHFVPRVRGRHNGHLRYTTAGLIDTGKLFVPGRG